MASLPFINVTSCSISEIIGEWQSSFLNHPVDGDTSVRADGGTGGTPNTGIGVRVGHEMIATIVDILPGQGQDSARAGHDTKVAPLAPFTVDIQSTNNFRHKLKTDNVTVATGMAPCHACFVSYSTQI